MERNNGRLRNVFMTVMQQSCTEIMHHTILIPLFPLPCLKNEPEPGLPLFASNFDNGTTHEASKCTNLTTKKIPRMYISFFHLAYMWKGHLQKLVVEVCPRSLV